MNVEKTVFISYRREGGYFSALLVYQGLRARGYDVFLDYESINSGSFDQIILNQIRARAHFLLVLHANTLLRCNEPGDRVRREIETAIGEKRNIIPITFPDFDWKADHAKPYLTGKLAVLGAYNALQVPEGYFDNAMEKLSTRYLDISLDLVIHPTPLSDVSAVQQRIRAAATAPVPTKDQLIAQVFYRRGVERHLRGDQNGAIAEYGEAIRLNPQYFYAYHDRGLARFEKGDNQGAIADYDEAIRLNPEYATAFHSRGLAHGFNSDYDSAIIDFTQALDIEPKLANSFVCRGLAYFEKEDYKRALSDYDDAIRLEPKHSAAYFSRSLARRSLGDITGADADLAEARRLGYKE